LVTGIALAIFLFRAQKETETPVFTKLVKFLITAATSCRFNISAGFYFGLFWAGIAVAKRA